MFCSFHFEGFEIPHLLEQFGSGQNGFQPNTAQKCFGTEQQAMSIFQVPYEQL